MTPAGENIFLHGHVVRPGTQPYALRMTLAQATTHGNGEAD